MMKWIFVFLLLVTTSCNTKKIILNGLSLFDMEQNNVTHIESYNISDFLQLEIDLHSCIMNAKQKKIIVEKDWECLKNIIYSVENNSNFLLFVLDIEGNIIISSNRKYERLNLALFTDYAIGLKNIYTSEFINFFYKHNTNKLHVSSELFKEINIQLVIIKKVNK